VVLSFASVCGLGASQIDELGLVCGQIWEEVAYSPGVAEMSVTTAWTDGAIHLEVEGRAYEEALPSSTTEWASRLTRVVVGHLTKTLTLHRSRDTIRIEADFPAEAIGPASS
jgi:hypothetical protein